MTKKQTAGKGRLGELALPGISRGKFLGKTGI